MQVASAERDDWMQVVAGEIEEVYAAVTPAATPFLRFCTLALVICQSWAFVSFSPGGDNAISRGPR